MAVSLIGKYIEDKPRLTRRKELVCGLLLNKQEERGVDVTVFFGDIRKEILV